MRTRPHVTVDAPTMPAATLQFSDGSDPVDLTGSLTAVLTAGLSAEQPLPADGVEFGQVTFADDVTVQVGPLTLTMDQALELAATGIVVCVREGMRLMEAHTDRT